MNIENILLTDEQILYRGVAAPKKGSKSILGLTILLAVSLIMLTQKANPIIIGVALLFLGLSIYGFVYNLFLKKRRITGQQYFITNQRAIVYSNSKNEFQIGYINRFEEFRVNNEKDNYGDVYMGIILNKSGEDKQAAVQDALNVANHLFNQDKSNMPFIIFESVENPHQVLEIAKTQRINSTP